MVQRNEQNLVTAKLKMHIKSKMYHVDIGNLKNPHNCIINILCHELQVFVFIDYCSYSPGEWVQNCVEKICATDAFLQGHLNLQDPGEIHAHTDFPNKKETTTKLIAVLLT